MGRNRLHDEHTVVALLDAAERLIEAGGLAALTVRRLADDVGTTTRAVYSTVGSKPALLGHLGARAFDTLGSRVDALPLSEDPAADLVAAGSRGFRAFVLGHPILFQIGVQQTNMPEEARHTIRPAAERALAPLHHRIRRLHAAGGLRNRSITDATWQFHAVCEGLAAVELRTGFAGGDTQRIWTDCLASLINGWATST